MTNKTERPLFTRTKQNEKSAEAQRLTQKYKEQNKEKGNESH